MPALSAMNLTFYAEKCLFSMTAGNYGFSCFFFNFARTSAGVKKNSLAFKNCLDREHILLLFGSRTYIVIVWIENIYCYCLDREHILLLTASGLKEKPFF